MRGDRIWPPLAVAAFALGALLDLPELRVPAGLVLIFLAPGWLVLRLGRAPLAGWYRLVLAAGVSFALALASLLVLELFGVPSTAGAVGTLVAGLTAALVVADLVRDTPPAAALRRLRSPGSWPVPATPLRPLVAPVLAGVVTVTLAGAAWGISAHTERAAAARSFTQVGLVPVTGTQRAFTVSVTNREGAGTAYRVVIESPSADRRVVPVTLADGATWSQVVVVVAKGTLEVTVHGGSSDTPASHRTVRAVVL
ncbi:hypothetical protein [Spirilliplanes yamanashiensis]|uniref:DUF1616 domain-containing protein n=1 Tax=Spirilliplanes yamanashiensis TaxID=42233 RepID=A0A8J3Y6M8_9ACTN|nr:hypothetical protein [Spirilliplanes yamanashiensis]MDP9814753.1 hypothetical protein [Spirilliplanes yamanashiensis]GIJ02407.1 hypothetical protein Sya03_17590 [Spirilliplanes yamanashiensis]